MLLVLGLPVIISCVALCVYTVSYGGSDDGTFSRRYYDGQYQIIEGVPKDYNDYTEGNTTFYIGKKWFCVDYRFGRNPVPRDQNMKIYYLPDEGGGNIVLKIEVKCSNQ